MKIKYLQSTHDSEIGDVKDVADPQADVLVKLGIAEIYKDSIMNISILKNLNDTPVIDDFGDVVTFTPVLVPKKRGRKKVN